MHCKQNFVLILALLLVAAGAASLDYAIPDDVVSSGGQHTTSADYAVDSTIGQPAVGLAASADYGLCHGFWCNELVVIPPIPLVIDYALTFGQIAAGGAALVLITLWVSRWIYDAILRVKKFNV